MGLLRTILVLLIIVILAHVGIVYLGLEEDQNTLTSSVVALAQFVETPATMLIGALPTTPEQQKLIEQNGFYVTALTAAGIYFILFLLLGVGRRG